MPALHYPYVLAFEPTFVEIRHIETGHMVQIIQGNNLRLLVADAPPSTTNGANHADGYILLASDDRVMRVELVQQQSHPGSQ